MIDGVDGRGTGVDDGEGGSHGRSVRAWERACPEKG
jgi:hypothetical protein